MWYASCKLSVESKSSSNKNKGKTGIGQSFGILPKVVCEYNTDVAPYTRPVRTVQWEGRDFNLSLPYYKILLFFYLYDIISVRNDYLQVNNISNLVNMLDKEN